MKATTGLAALAASGLLALSACVHGGGDGPPTAETDMTTESLNESRGAGSAQILEVTAQAATSMPEFGSVLQAAAVDLASTSSVSTSFDGTDLTIMVSREDGSALTLDTGTDHSDASEPAESPIAGHSAWSWSLVNIDEDGISAAIALITANDADSADYLTAGYWVHLAGDLTELTFTGAEIGAFVDGPELSLSSPPTLPMQGSASYYGPAGGAYALVHGMGEAGIPGATEIGEFASTVELTADFAVNTIGGCVGCRDGVALFGVLYDPETGEETDVFSQDSGYSLHLDATSFGANGTFGGEEMRLRHAVIDIISTTGAWGGQFSNIADSAGDPRLVAGTFGAEAVSAGGSQGAFLGSFIGPRE